MATQLSQNAVTPFIPEKLKENVTDPIIPFEADFDDGGVSDIDLLSALCGVSEPTTMVTNTSNVTNSAPHVMISHCHIRAINITFNKK